jgi:hypothetical protein
MPTTAVKQVNPLAVRLSPVDLAWLRAEREATGTPVNALISKAVTQYRTRIEAARKGKANRGTHS